MDNYRNEELKRLISEYLRERLDSYSIIYLINFRQRLNQTCDHAPKSPLSQQ